MENERFTIPELLFRPDDIGLEQSGLAATVAASISLLPHDLRGMFWANIGLIGGSTNFPGFYERLSSELLSLTPVEYDLQIYRSEDAISEAYRSAIAFANDPGFSNHVVTREEYLEVGSNASRKKFPGWQSSSAPGDAEISKITQESMIEDRPQPSRKLSRPRVRATAVPRRHK
jgi:actin-related protein 6